MQWSKVKSVKKLEGDTRQMWDISCYPTPSFFANGIGVHNCQYCESPMAGSFTVRAMTPQRIQDEVRHIRDDFGIHGITFFDDEMNLYRDRMLGICKKLGELGDIVWRGFVVTAKFDREIAHACKESGCYEIASGIESGSPDILRSIRKPATKEINRRFIKTAKAAGLRVKAFCIVGLPSESWDTIRETDQFFEELRREGCQPDDVDFSILQIYPGAPLYQRPQDVEFDSFTDFDKMYYKSSPGSYADLIQVKTKMMSKEDLIAARNYLEEKWKPKNWVIDHSSRKDLDRVYETIQYAHKKLLR